MDSMIFFFLASVLVIAGIVLYVLFRLNRTSTHVDVEKFRRRWLEIEGIPKRDDLRSCQFAVIEGDKLLDIAMKEHGIRGETMGERLKTAKARWSDRNSLWAAHKLRNQLVHEADVNISYETARRALASFKRALKDIGAI